MAAPEPDSFVEKLAAPTPTPGGGAAAARVGATAAALVRMVLGITLEKPDSDAYRAELAGILERAVALCERFRRLEEEDARVFERYMEALRLPSTTPEERSRRKAARQAAACRSADVPLETMRAVRSLIEEIAGLRKLSANVRLRARSDLDVAFELARGALRAACSTVEANDGELPPAELERVREERAALIRAADELGGTPEP